MSFAPGTCRTEGGGIPVEIDFRVGEVGDDEEVVLLRQRHELPVEGKVGHVGGGVGGEVDDQRGGFGHRVADGAVDRGEHFIARLGGDGAHGGAGDDEAELVDRVGGVGDQDGVARRGDGGGEVGQAFLGAECRDDFGFRVEFYPEAAVVIGRRARGAGRGCLCSWSSGGCAGPARFRPAWRRYAAGSGYPDCPCRGR